LTTADWEPLRQAHMIGEGDCPLLADDGTAPGTVILLEDSNNRVELRVETAADGWLVLADTFYPGWTALVDGEPADIHRANLAFRAQPVPAGDETVEFVYRDRKSTRLNSSHVKISYAVCCLKKQIRLP